MKQIITKEQLKELSTTQKVKLYKWWIDKGIKMGDIYYLNVNGTEFINCSTKPCKELSYDGTKVYYEYYPLLNIGQMIELLDDCDAPFVDLKLKNVNELCDAFWESVKSIL